MVMPKDQMSAAWPYPSTWGAITCAGNTCTGAGVTHSTMHRVQTLLPCLQCKMQEASYNLQQVWTRTSGAIQQGVPTKVLRAKYLAAAAALLNCDLNRPAGQCRACGMH
jgi:hypothetical protein